MATSALDKLVDKMLGTYTNGVVMDLRRIDSIPEVERVPLESPKMESLFGTGGVPVGRVIEIFGGESSGKSSMCEYIAGQFQKHTFEKMNDKGELVKRKGVVVYIDAENAISLDFAFVHGFDVSKAILVQPESGEQACDIAIQFAESGLVDLIILDSIAALTPVAEIEGDMEQQFMGLQARMLSKFFRKVSAILNKTGTTMLCVNQTRTNLGVYGAPDTTPGGKSLKFFSSVRINLRKKEDITEKDEAKGIIIACKTVKNKTAPPMVKQLLTMMWDTSFDARMEWVDFAIENGIIEMAGGGNATLPSGTKVKGKANLIEYLSKPENKEEYDKVIKLTREKMEEVSKSKPKRVSVDEDDEDDIVEDEE